MPALTHAFSSSVIRAAEQPLLDAQTETDELMRQAAHAVAIAAQTMLTASPTQGANRVLVLAGAGGNGGDGLYAGAALAAAGYPVDALLVGRDRAVHADASDAFVEAGGAIIAEYPQEREFEYALVIDAILGIGGNGPLSLEVAQKIRRVNLLEAPILAVDVPSGIDADTGFEPEAYTDGGEVIPAYILADVTVTFGGLRYAHCLTTACGEVIAANLAIGEDRLSTRLANTVRDNDSPTLYCHRAVEYETRYQWPAMFSIPTAAQISSTEPGPRDNKYSGGVVGICAGSAQYPGAALLTANAAVRATSFMVRYVGNQAREVVRAYPEIVAAESLADAQSVHTWVFGPGRGTDDEAAAELAQLLASDLPVLIDADGLTLLSERPELRAAVQGRRQATVLTPHAGEFRRIVQSLDTDVPDPVANPVAAACAMVREFNCAVVLKGRFTLVAYPAGSSVSITSVDAGTSWAATPGSGDVLAGLMGARMAYSEVAGPRVMPGLAEEKDFLPAYFALSPAVHIHGVASWLSAQTPDGPAATSASRIARFIPRATARLTAY